ncbi:MAG: Mur ligase family protein, partial [Sediminibacterium sp.]|nr:Mur ligase family protein [Sediminibacterium sp.]
MQNNKLIIIGIGESGIGAALLAKKMNYDFIVIADKIDDLKLKYLHDLGIPFSLQNESIDIILQAKEVVKSPGISNENELILLIKKNQIPIISEIEFAYRHKGTSKIIAITGSNGKSTTTSLIHFICTSAGINCSLVGNIGTSIAKQIAEEPTEWYVTEVSSFQLDDIVDFKPDIAILLNITADHLDRYDYKMQHYIN